LASKPQKLITLNTWRGASRFFAKSLCLLQQALIEGKFLFETASFHGALLHSARGRRERNRAFSSQIKATILAVVVGWCALQCRKNSPQVHTTQIKRARDRSPAPPILISALKRCECQAASATARLMNYVAAEEGVRIAGMAKGDRSADAVGKAEAQEGQAVI
jgi:hypothetical protein